MTDARICRAKGHKWSQPLPESHFYRGNDFDRRCSRCGVWESDMVEKPAERNPKISENR